MKLYSVLRMLLKVILSLSTFRITDDAVKAGTVLFTHSDLLQKELVFDLVE